MDSGPPGSIIGHVDLRHDDWIVGWIANLNNPDHLETVLCQDAEGRSIEFKACHYRPDVCEWLKLSGRFGFVIPRSALRNLGKTIAVCNRRGEMLPNGDAVNLLPRLEAAHEKTTIFLHIPKTAGTSIQLAITEGLAPCERLFIYAAPYGLDLTELGAMPIEQRRAARLLVGHCYYGIDRFLGREAQYVTFLRNPLARLRSHAAHHQLAGTVFERRGRTMSLSQVINDGMDAEFDNLMVRSVAGLTTDIVSLGDVGEKDVELAMYNIERHFAMVGFVETLASHADQLSQVLGWKVGPIGVGNVTGPAGLERLKDVDWELVDRRNRFDHMLYDRVRVMAARSVPDERPLTLKTAMFGVAA